MLVFSPQRSDHLPSRAMTVANLSNKEAVTQRSKANFFRNVDVSP